MVQGKLFNANQFLMIIKNTSCFRSKICDGPLDCVEDDITVTVGAKISKSSACPACPASGDPSPAGKECHLLEDGEEVCLCPYGQCEEDTVCEGDGDLCDPGQVTRPNITTDTSPLPHCQTSPCLNGGECLENSQSSLCECKPGKIIVDRVQICYMNVFSIFKILNIENVSGYSGPNCEIDINECEPDPCVHGSCTDLTAAFSCDCEQGWEGRLCDLNIDDCLTNTTNICHNGGYCNDLLNDYQA